MKEELNSPGFRTNLHSGSVKMDTAVGWKRKNVCVALVNGMAGNEYYYYRGDSLFGSMCILEPRDLK